MPEKNLLTANQVREQFGFARSSLLRWEEEGKIKAIRTPGGQRRYDIQQLQGVMQGEIYAEPQEKRPPYRELGTAGATRWGSALESEFLPELRGASRYAMYREMRMNDPVIAAVLFAVEATLKQAKWRVKPASEKQEDKDCAEFIDQCHPAGTMIRLASGILVPIESISVGDKVVTHRGKSRYVSEVKHRLYTGNLYTIKRAFSNEVLSATASHPILIRKRNLTWKRRKTYSGENYGPQDHVNTNNTEWVNASELLVGDVVLEPINHSMKAPEPIDLRPFCSTYMEDRGHYDYLNKVVEITPGVMKLLGYWIAEGSSTNGCIQFTLHADEVEMQRDISSILKDAFGITTILRPRPDAPNAVDVFAYCAPLARYLRSEFRPSGKKALPLWVERLDKESTTAFLLGHFLGDGGSTKDSFQVTVGGNNAQLAESIRRMYLRLGIVPSWRSAPGRDIKVNGVSSYSKPSFVLTMQGEHAHAFAGVMGIEYRKSGKNWSSKAFITNGMACYPITDITVTDVDSLDVYNMEVEQDHSFIANGIASHNCLNDMSFSWSDTLDFVLLMLEQGFSVLEPVYKRRLGPNPPNYTKDPAQSKYFDGRIGWRKWAPRPATTLVEGEEWEYDETGGIKGCNQGDNYGNKKFIPIERLLLFRTTAAPANAPDGISILRGMYVPYYYGKNFQEIEGIGVERDLGGLPVIYLGSNCSLTGENSDYEMAKKLAENMRSDTQVGVVIPNHKMGTTPDSTGVLIELLSSQSTRAHNVSEIIDRYDRLKALAALAQFIMLGMQKVGSFALAGTQNDLFTRAVATWLTKISDVINRFAIPRLLRYNAFPDITGMPEIEPSDVGTPNLQDLSWYINNLVGQEVIKPDIELERHLRHVARLPEPMEEDETSGQPRRKMDIKDNALVLRRIILAMKELPTYESMTDEELWALVAPLVDQLRLSVEDRTGVKIPNLDQGDKTTGLTMGELDLKSAAKKKTAAAAGTPRLDVRPGTGTIG